MQILKFGEQLKCPRCGDFHLLDRGIGWQGEMSGGGDGRMLFVTCRGGLYFAGIEGYAPVFPAAARKGAS